MARKIFITNDMSEDDSLTEIIETEECPMAALFWPWFLTFFDDWGRAPASAARVKARIVPMNPLVGIPEIASFIEIYARQGLIGLYEVDNKKYMAIHPDKWFSFQTHIRTAKRMCDQSKFPANPAWPALPSAKGVSGAQNSEDDDDSAQVRAFARDDAHLPSNDNPRGRCSPSPSLSNQESLTLSMGDEAGASHGENGSQSEAPQEETSRIGLGDRPGSADEAWPGMPGETAAPPPRSPVRAASGVPRHEPQAFESFRLKYPRQQAPHQIAAAWDQVQPSHEQIAQIEMHLAPFSARPPTQSEMRCIKAPAKWLTDFDFVSNVPFNALDIERSKTDSQNKAEKGKTSGKPGDFKSSSNGRHDPGRGCGASPAPRRDHFAHLRPEASP
ncbi:hypothetical protein CCAX7_54900 [Capsulimonas corticalis]|uniref:Uncharacterized protein n=1 Tax=Capsulimonas corticalis TaxID=2219043 RepID=A0A402D5X2_9BACT|nr:hypothetical protein [Capsulimonas corticalis]BDI33439.1 hypothetical protein CCAX7_54900 [Capsulimonas corticalis]